jgi:hypothetical protein
VIFIFGVPVFGIYIVVVVLFFVVGTGILVVRTYVRAAIFCLMVLYERVRFVLLDHSFVSCVSFRPSL